MIRIDFVGGAHGNYLEFVCNKIAGIVDPDALPFNTLGSSHLKPYCGPQVFFAGHYSNEPETYTKISNRIISIQITKDDLLPLQQVSLLRSGDYGYNNDLLEVNTFNKLNNLNYRWVLDTLIDGFFNNQIRNSYDAVKDPSWPNITSIAEFSQLPNHIRTECIQQHGLVLLELTEENPDCPRRILREFFKIGFQHSHNHGLIAQQKKAIYSRDDDVYMFPFNCFYNKTKFLDEIKKVAAWAGFLYTCEDEIRQLHNEFLTRQQYKDSKNKCDQIIVEIKSGKNIELSNLTMLEEAYINSLLDKDYFQ